jgi:hyperosmotically inducible protein
MLGALVRLVLVVVVIAAIGAFFLGYRLRDGGVVRGPDEQPVATTGKLPDVDTTKARETGAAIGEKVATGANDAQRALSEMALQGKIKSKMALDDLVKASDINVDSLNGVVTLTGRVGSEAERARAVQLARETDGVTRVTDRLVIK